MSEPITYWPNHKQRVHDEAPTCENCGTVMVKADQKRHGVQKWICYGRSGVVCSRAITEPGNAPWHKGGQKSRLPPDPELARLVATMPMQKVAEKCGVGIGHLRDVVRKKGFKERFMADPHNIKRPTLEQFQRYADQGYSAPEVCDLLNVAPATVFRWQEHFGIKLDRGAWGGNRKRRMRGEKHYAAKLTANQVIEIRDQKGKVPQRKLAEQYGVSYGTIADIMAGRKWVDVKASVEPTETAPRKRLECLPWGNPFGGGGWHNHGMIHNARGEYA